MTMDNKGRVQRTVYLLQTKRSRWCSTITPVNTYKDKRYIHQVSRFKQVVQGQRDRPAAASAVVVRIMRVKGIVEWAPAIHSWRPLHRPWIITTTWLLPIVAACTRHRTTSTVIQNMQLRNRRSSRIILVHPCLLRLEVRNQRATQSTMEATIKWVRPTARCR